MFRATGMAITLAMLFLLSFPARAADLVVVTSRTANATELYLSANAATMLDLFGADADLLPGQDGAVDFSTFQEGTFELGDKLIAPAALEIGGEDGGFETMSLMLHPVEDKLPMTDPVEGMIAISVCTAPPQGALVPLAALHGYIGFFTETDSRTKPIRLIFPTGGRSSLQVEVHEYGRDGRTARYETVLENGASLVLAPPAPGPGPVRYAVPAGIALLALLAALAAFRLMHRRFTTA